MTGEFSGLAIIVVSYGSADLLAENLIETSRGLPGSQTVVVDNWTTTAERARARCLAKSAGWSLIEPNENTGFGTGCNLAAAHAIAAGAQTLLLLNPDARIGPESVRALVGRLSGEPKAIIAPRIVDEAGKLWSAGMDVDLETGDMRPWRRRREFPNARTLPWLTGACMLVPVELWTELGGFDDEYFLYWEDVDLSVRAQKLGAELVLVEEAVAHHAVGATQERTRGASKSTTYYYFNIRNRSVFARKNLDLPTRRRWKKTSIPAAWSVLRRGGRRQFMNPVGPLRAMVRGLRDSDYGAGT